jgi:glutamate-1-semialdehyde aminotransferase
MMRPRFFKQENEEQLMNDLQEVIDSHKVPLTVEEAMRRVAVYEREQQQ